MGAPTIDELKNLATIMAGNHQFRPSLVKAIIHQESRWRPTAWNPEPRYRYFWNVATGQPFREVTDAEISSEKPPADFRTMAGDTDQEWWAQQASWGLMQVMGAVARERGCIEPFLPALVYPEVNLQFGLRHLRALMNRWKDEKTALLRWNGGGNPNYPAEVLDKEARFYLP